MKTKKNNLEEKLVALLASALFLLVALIIWVSVLVHITTIQDKEIICLTSTNYSFSSANKNETKYKCGPLTIEHYANIPSFCYNDFGEFTSGDDLRCSKELNSWRVLQ